LQVVITQYGGAFFNTTPLPLDLWLKILAVGACIVVISELTKIPLRFLKHEAH
jgi:Ca2+-transporting ATPase